MVWSGPVDAGFLSSDREGGTSVFSPRTLSAELLTATGDPGFVGRGGWSLLGRFGVSSIPVNI